MSNQSNSDIEGESTSSLIIKVAVVTICRLVLNTARRFAYPFAPVLSRSLGVPLTAITSLIAVNQATAILGMFFGPVADRLGYRLIMLAGLTMLVVGMLAASFFPYYAVLLFTLFLAGMAKSIFDPAVQAYISERVPYRRRGLAIGFLEVSWAGSTLVGIPVIGLLISALGWRSPFLVMGVLGLIGIVILRKLMPAKKKSDDTLKTSFSFRDSWKQLVAERTALGALGFALFASIANDNLFVVYGAWIENAFQLSIVALGLGTSVIGIAELLGESMTAALADRFGLKRSVMVGLLLSTLCYAILPLFGKTLSLALAGLFLIFFTFEFMIVTSLSLMTELLPGSRATMMAGCFATAGIGRVIGALIGGPIWLAGGILTTSLISACLSGLALVSLSWGLYGWQKS
ncbi:MAG: MFS transporter [Desulfobacterales bacterium]|jgi:predicted MFS family arabinose efflux permease